MYIIQKCRNKKIIKSSKKISHFLFLIKHLSSPPQKVHSATLARSGDNLSILNRLLFLRLVSILRSCMCQAVNLCLWRQNSPPTSPFTTSWPIRVRLSSIHRLARLWNNRPKACLSARKVFVLKTSLNVWTENRKWLFKIRYTVQICLCSPNKFRFPPWLSKCDCQFIRKLFVCSRSHSRIRREIDPFIFFETASLKCTLENRRRRSLAYKTL